LTATSVLALTAEELKDLGVCKCSAHPFLKFVKRYISAAGWDGDEDLTKGLAMYNDATK
jgi:hypothetical protein